MLSISDIQSIINPYKNTMPSDDFRMINTWAEYKDEPEKKLNDRTLDYLCYEIEVINPATGERIHVYKAIKFLRITRLPKSAKQSTSLMNIHAQLLSGVYSENMNFVTVIANLIDPPLGILFLYGVQGVASTIEKARKIANSNFHGLTAMLTGSYRVLGFSELRSEESEWLRAKLFAMDYITVVRGIPKASDKGEDGGNKGFGGKNVNPDSQGTLEELITGMADCEYVLQILSTPVKLNTLRGWLTQTEREMTIWYEQLQGTKSLSFNISIPMMFAANNSTSSGTSQAYTHSDSTSVSQSESYNTSYGENVGRSLSESFGQSYGITQGTSVTDSVSQSHSISQGTSIGQSFGETVGQSYGTTLGQSFGQTQSVSLGQSLGHTTGLSSGETIGQSLGQSYGTTSGQTYGLSTGNSTGQSYGRSIGETTGTSYGQSKGQTFGQSAGQTIGHTQGETLGQSIGESYGGSHNVTQTDTISEGHNANYSHGNSTTYTHGIAEGNTYNVNQTQSNSFNHTIGQNQGLGYTIGDTYAQSETGTVTDTDSKTGSLGIADQRGIATGRSGGGSAQGSMGMGGAVSESENLNLTAGNAHQQGGTGSKTGTFGLNANNMLTKFFGSLSGSMSNTFAENFGKTGSVAQAYGNGLGYTENGNAQVSGGVNYQANMTQNAGLTVNGSETIGDSHAASHGGSYQNGGNLGENYTYGGTETYAVGNNLGKGQSWGATSTDSESQSIAQNVNQSWGDNIGRSNGISNGYGINQSMSSTDSYSQSASDSMSRNTSNSYSQNMSESLSKSMSNSSSQSATTSNTQSMSESQSKSISESATENMSNSFSKNLGSSTSDSLTNSQTLGTSTSQTTSMSQSQTQSYSQSQTQSYSKNQSESMGVTQGRSVGQSSSESITRNTSEGSSSNWGQSSSVGQGTSTGNTFGQSLGESLGISRSMASGMSASMGISPSIGYNRSHQWLDQQVQDIIEMLQFQDDRIKMALRGNGAFFTYVYFACPSMDALAAAKAVAKSTWQNEYALTNPLQVLDLETEEQKHLLYHFSAFSADVSKIKIAGAETYKYCTILLPSEFVAYTHLPRISEGGIFAEVNDIPHFAVPSMLKGEIYMGTILSAERSTLKHGYETQFDYRISEKELMHGFFTGASRSGKTVAAMRFIAELSKVRRSKTGKRLRIVCMDPKDDWRTLARYVEPERFKFYSLGNANFHPLYFNPCKIPRGVQPQLWIDGMIDVFCRAYGLLERGKQMMGETIYALYNEAGVFKVVTDDTNPGWEEEVAELSSHVTFRKVYRKMEAIRDGHEKGIGGKMGNDTRDAFARLLDRLQCFNRDFSIEYKLFGQEKGMSVDELIGADDVVVLESAGLESTFSNFIFGVITSGFYKEAKSHEGGFLNEAQYETVLVIEEANKVFTGSDVAGTGSGRSFGMTGQSEFEEMLDQAAGLGLFVFAITQKIAEMPSSIIANSGLVFAGKLKRKEDVEVVVRTIAREERYEDRDLVKWFPRSPTGWFVCQSSRTYNFMDAEPILVKIARLNVNKPTNAEIEEILTHRDAILSLQ